MKKNLLIITAFLLYAVTIHAQPNTWTQKADFGGVARNNAVGFTIAGKGYIGTGWYNGTNPLKDFWEYDPATNTWAKKADFPGSARGDAVGFSIGNKAYVGGGGAGYYEPYNKDFWEYDPATDKWTRKADLPGIARHMAAGFSIGNKGYYGTGKTESPYVFYKDFWEYDPATDEWTRKADYGGDPIDNVAFFAIGGKGYIGCGYTNNSGWVKDFWEYNPSTNKWTRKADFGGSEREYAVGLSIGNKGYIGTGYPQRLKDFWEYDPATNTWTRKADVGGPARALAVGFSIGSKGYIGTGNDNVTDLKDIWEYCPRLDTPGVIKGQITNLCGGGAFNYKIDTVPGALYYTWTVPSNTSIIAGQGSNTIRLKINGNFTGGNLSVTAKNLCGSSAPSTIALNAKPAKPSTITGPSTVAAHQTGIVFSVKNERVNFNWSVIPLDAVITSGWGTNKITVTWGSTSGYVGVSASNACGLSETRGKAIALSGSNAIAREPATINSNFDIYPNPAKNNCVVVFNEKKQVHYTLSITNTNGKTVFIKQGESFDGINMITVDMNSFPAGLYLVNLFDIENGTRNERLTKE